ncbi:MAG: hypothetical protein ACOYXR_06135 [Nitrospirota bacterium]
MAASLLALLIAGSSLRDVGAGSAGYADRLGPTYPILEPDWSTWLPAQMQKRLEKQSLGLPRDRVRSALRRQDRDLDLPEAMTPRTYTVDPTVRVPRPATDLVGRNLAAGEALNPMSYLAGFRPILIIDGGKDRHVQWAKRILARTNSIVLALSGDVPALSARLGAPVYFAPPLLLERLSITRAPVVVSGEGGLVRVDEVVP